MKQIYTLFTALILAPLGVSAQVVTTQPAVLQQSSQGVVITFHADQGNKGLMGLTASTPIYAHTGVILQGTDSWSYAPTWLDNSDKYKLTYVSPNTWELNIGNINTYYGLKSTDKVDKLCFVFRNANGSKEGKAEGNGDIFIDVLPEGFQLEVTAEPSTLLLSKPTTVKVTAHTTSPGAINLYVGSTASEPIASTANASDLSCEYYVSVVGDTKIIATASDGSQTLTKSVTYCLVEGSEAADYPGGKPVMGPVANADGSVTFCLAAPKKSSAMIVGSWNDFAISASQVMKVQTVDGNPYFWVTIPNLQDGKDYIYYFVVDNTQKVGDPYARLVLDPFNDKYIPASVFPSMPAYPSEYVQKVPLAIYNSNNGKYDWKVKDFKGVDQSKLIIYELLIRDFTGEEDKSNASGTIAGVMDKLDYLQQLGVNAIELLPIMEFNGNNSWGYNTNFYFAPDKAYGTPDDYRRLIDECHARGMAVILDIVFNQTDGLHPWYQLYPISSNPFYNGTAPHAYSVLNDWNQDNPLVQQQFKDAVKYWITDYNVDGYRFDLVKGLGSNQSYGATYNASNNTWSGVTDAKTNAYNASRVARMKELHNAMREVKPDAYFINENLAGAQEENDMAKDGEINWANINDASCQMAMGYQSDSNLNRFYAPQDSRTWGSTVSYAESHDEERMAYKISKYGIASVKNSVEMTTRRLGSVGAIMLMTPGAHMIWQFQEFGADQTTKQSDGGNDTSPKKVIWSYLDEPNHKGLMQSYKELCRIRQDNPDMFDEGITTAMNCGAGNWSGGRTIQLTKGSRVIWLAVNPQTSGNVTISLPLQIKSTTPKVLSASYNVTPNITASTITLPAGAYAVLGSPDMVDVPSIDADRDVNIYSADGMIKVDGDYDSMRVFNISGAEVNAQQPVAPGLYIVDVDGVATKLIVR